MEVEGSSQSKPAASEPELELEELVDGEIRYSRVINQRRSSRRHDGLSPWLWKLKRTAAWSRSVFSGISL